MMWGYIIITAILVGPHYSYGLAWSPRYADEDSCESARFETQLGFQPWLKPGDPVITTMRCQVWP